MSTGAKIGLFGCAGPTALLLLMGGCMAFAVGSGDSSDVSEDTADVAEADTGDETTDEAHGLGETFEHGSFSFTVHSVENGVASLEDEFGLTQEARGEYIVVELNAENVSSSAEYLSGNDQVLMDADGNMYEYDITASTDASFVDQLNPGQSAEATLVYDVNEGTEIDHMLVNGKGTFDEGVRVDLS